MKRKLPSGYSPPGTTAPDELATALSQPDEVISLNDEVGTEALQALADGRLRQHMAMMRGSLTCLGFDTVKPASWLSLAGLGDRFNGDIYVTGVRHEFSPRRWISRIQFGLDAKWFAQQIGGAMAMVQTPRLNASKAFVWVWLPPCRSGRCGQGTGKNAIGRSRRRRPLGQAGDLCGRC
ncbi:MAG: hypothetical protein R3B47_08855 [Bacteroidia bacterium]